MSEKKTSIPAISLKSLAGIAPTFDMPVKINVRGSDPITINMQCNALKKTEWAKLRDEVNDAMRERTDARIKAAEEDKGRLHISDVLQEGMQSDADVIMKFATGWDLADDLTAANLQALEDICGGATRAIVEAYEAAIYQNRLGN